MRHINPVGAGTKACYRAYPCHRVNDLCRDICAHNTDDVCVRHMRNNLVWACSGNGRERPTSRLNLFHFVQAGRKNRPRQANYPRGRRPVACHKAYPFVAPAVIPPTNRSMNRKYSNATGTDAKVDAAMRGPQK